MRHASLAALDPLSFAPPEPRLRYLQHDGHWFTLQPERSAAPLSPLERTAEFLMRLADGCAPSPLALR